MVLVTFVVIITFVYFYNTNSRGGDRSEADIAGKAYGRTVSGAEFKRMARKFEICQLLQLNDLWSGLGFIGNPKSRMEMEENYIWNSYVLRHEADELGIVPNADEIVNQRDDAMSSGLPPQQGLYDPENEHDACGVGFVVDLKGRKTHKLVRDGLTALINLDHDGVCGVKIEAAYGPTPPAVGGQRA